MDHLGYLEMDEGMSPLEALVGVLDPVLSPKGSDSAGLEEYRLFHSDLTDLHNNGWREASRENWSR